MRKNKAYFDEYGDYIQPYPKPPLDNDHLVKAFVYGLQTLMIATLLSMMFYKCSGMQDMANSISKAKYKIERPKTASFVAQNLSMSAYKTKQR